MAVKVMMPKGSDTMTEGKVLKWLKQEGDTIATGDSVVEIETDKVDMEVESLGSGVLRKILVEVGKVVPVGQLLAVIAKPDEDISALVQTDGNTTPAPAPATASPTASAPTASAPAKPAATPPTSTKPGPIPTAPAASKAATAAPGSSARPEVAAGGNLAATPVADTAGRVLASPLAKKMARDIGLDIANIAGSGPGGRIIRQDVERSAALASQARVAPNLLPTRLAPSPVGPEFVDEPLSSIRKVIATRLVQSKAPIPHFYLTLEVDMKRVKELRESASLASPGLKLSYNDVIMKACAAALRLNPEVNASFQGESIRYYNRVHVGMAVATDGGGLITPVIRDCDTKSLHEISQESKDLVARARTRKLLPNEYVGSTFSISNLGMMGIEEFSAVINPPEAAILAVGAVTEKPVVVDGRVDVGLRCRLTLSCDHRVVDGALGAKFLQSLRQIIENPMYLAF